MTQQMIATIAKHFTFDAAHRLDRLPADHKCHRVHGHTYKVELVLIGPVNPETGMIVDYADIETAYREAVHDRLDHRYLNDVPGLEVPTTEILVPWILRALVGHHLLRGPLVESRAIYEPARSTPIKTTLLSRVRVKESSTTWCEMDAFEVDGIVPWYIAGAFA